MYLKFEKEDSDTLLLSFSGKNSTVKFDFYNSFTKHSMCDNIDVIFLGDAQGHFYLGGISEFSLNFEETLFKIKQLCINKKYKKILLVGTSMGGFGSILHALFLAEIPEVPSMDCLVFNPYTKLNGPWIRKIQRAVSPDLMFYMQQRGISKKDVYKIVTGLDYQRIDLRLVIDLYNLKKLDKVKIHVVYGNVKREIAMVDNLKYFKNLTKEMFQISEHNIAGELSRANKLTSILKSFIFKH